jgi:3-hydroxybutyryl-CoA dehydratase
MTTHLSPLAPAVAQPSQVVNYFEDLTLGQEARMERRVLVQNVMAFADITGDRNPVHLDADYANTTMFKGCITHGMLTASYISAVFGMQLPGPGAIYVSQSLNFKGPVRVGDTVITTVQVVELLQRQRVRFKCACTVEGRTVLEGEAVLMVPSRPV